MFSFGTIQNVLAPSLTQFFEVFVKIIGRDLMKMMMRLRMMMMIQARTLKMKLMSMKALALLMLSLLKER